MFSLAGKLKNTPNRAGLRSYFVCVCVCVCAGKVLVHCTVGVSRSATLVLAYLMIRQNLTLVEAIKTVKDHRGVIPNRGFLRQLNGLDGILRESRKTSQQS